MSFRPHAFRQRDHKLSRGVLVGLWLLAGSALVAGQPSNDPDAIAKIKALFALDRGGRGEEIFSETSPALGANFSPGFIAAWKAAKARYGEPSSLEGDPLSGQQESNGEKPVRFALEGVDTVVATLAAPGSNARGGGYPVRFKFVEVAGHKLIDDIEDPAALAQALDAALASCAAVSPSAFVERSFDWDATVRRYTILAKG